MTIQFDTRAFERGIDNGVDGYERDGQTTLERLGDFIAARIKAQVPVDTGEVRDNVGIIAIGRDADGPYVDVGVNPTSDRHEIYVEFGTDDTPPQSFARPAFAEAPGRFGK